MKLEHESNSHAIRNRSILNVEQDVDLEVMARAAGGDCWVSGHLVGQRKLVVVMEGRGEGGLQEAAVTTARFAATHTPGLF